MYEIEPVAFVKNTRDKLEDDYWGNVLSEIILTDNLGNDCLNGIEEFSHLEIIFYFHLCGPHKTDIHATHPRGNENFPRVGIFAQRKKARPNLLGCTIVRLLEVSDRTLIVSGLDAINETPVIDIKPVFREFIPSEPVLQPHWADEIMKKYWMKRVQCCPN